ncbi:MAG: hypothetical protein IK031_02070 [Bacteroidales bacterium]|nr:hypothetical protein [Bacteroidales bacterium]
MKHLTSTLIIAALACSCVNPELKRAELGNPIIPVRETGAVTEVYLTDYLPGVDPGKLGRISVTEGYDSLKVEDGVLTLYGNAARIGVLSAGKVAIPILPKLPVVQGLTTAGIEDGRIVLKADGDYRYLCFVQNRLLPEGTVKDGGIELRSIPRIKGRSYLRVFAGNGEVILNDVLIPLQNGCPVLDAGILTRHDPNAQVLYSLMVDRFFNGNPGNDAPLNRPDVDPRVDYKGGDLKGITEKIREGFFDNLGVNTIWISPITQNPEDAWGQYHNPDTKFSGYHGYWPIYNTKVDPRMGTDDELRELLATAHEHDINVILDYVANHMHINSPTLKAHPDWITDSLLADGRRNFELWDEARLTTWFDKHIPTLDLEREEVCDAMTDTALFWVQNFEFDGYRHDACKHIPLNYWRMFTRKMKTRFPDRPLWMIGETYGDNELVGSYVKTGMLDAQFDFNIYHTAIDVLGKEGVPMSRLASVIDESLASYGAHHTMGNISGNHDKTRFISLAGGAVSWDEDGKAAGWNRSIGVTADGNPARELVAFKKALLLEVINLTIPGVPCIYQGDEYGQAGGNDPDNRRMMRFDGLSANEQWLLGQTEELIRLRRSSMPLLYGDYRLLYADDNALVFTRSYMGEEVTVAVNDGPEVFTYDAEGRQITAEPYGYTIEG